MGALLPLGPNGLILPSKSLRMPSGRLAVPRGLVSYWPLSSESVNLATNKTDDLMPGGFALDLTSIAGTDLADTITGGGITFDGVNDYALTATPAASAISFSAPFSLTCWVNASALGINLFFTLGDAGGSATYLGYRSDVSNKFVFTADGSGTFASSDATPSTGKSYFLAGVANANAAGGIVLFVNGAQQAATGSAWGCGGSTDAFTAIAAAISTGAKAAGTLFECRTYNRALDAGEVMQLYQTGLAGRRDQMFGLSQWDAPALFMQAASSRPPTMGMMGVGP